MRRTVEIHEDKPLLEKSKPGSGAIKNRPWPRAITICTGVVTAVALTITIVLLCNNNNNNTSSWVDRSFPEECKVLTQVATGNAGGTGFQWGVATASYQVEGAVKEGGRSPSIWDTFSHTPGKVAKGDTGDVACDQYHRYPEDVKLMTAMGVNFYRFSISWSRLVPGGVAGSPLNTEGLKYYSNLVDSLLAANITPVVTLYHWDLPAVLEEAGNNTAGWYNPLIVDHFVSYVDAAFKELGGRVKHWITFNEPWVFCRVGYQWGSHAPGKSGLNPYVCGHHVLLAHARASHLYRTQYQPTQRGVLGITLNSGWNEPWTNTTKDREAAERAQLFELGWFADPIWKGDYPPVMRERLGSLLPPFTQQEKTLLNGSSDFFGLNHYTTGYISHDPLPAAVDPIGVIPHKRDKWGRLIGPQAESFWLYVVPWGFRKLLTWIHQRYDGPEIWVTENGVSVPKESALPLQAALDDSFRVGYYRGYLQQMCLAVRDQGVRVKSYTAWSLMDNFEWADGYDVRFGLHYVDFNGTLARYPKASSKWLTQFFNFTVAKVG